MKEKIELVGSVEVAKDVEKRVETVGVRGLNLEQARELGVFQRIGHLLSLVHAGILASYSVYGHVDYLVDELHAKKNEIAREMNMFDKSFERFIRFWTSYYKNDSKEAEVMQETENLYHRMMEWAELPEEWQLGGEQRTSISISENAIKVKLGNDEDDVCVFRQAVLNPETLSSDEKWGVLKYEPKVGRQKCEHSDMDKASALMTAKRLSADDTNSIYTAAMIREVTEKRTEVVPFKAFRNNETVGKLIRTEKRNG